MAGLATTALLPCCGCGRSAGTEVGESPGVEGEIRHFPFTAADVDRLPPGWEVTRTGSGQGSQWVIVADETAPSSSGYVIAQTAESPRSMFNLCVVQGASYADVRLSVAFKAVEGRIDQGGGLVWRYVDANNYYVCRANPLEDNLRIYRVIAGNRKQLASIDMEMPTGKWHTLTVTMKGDLIVTELGETRLAVRDETFTRAGRIGLWTKADARTHFDALSVKGRDVAAEVSNERQTEEDIDAADIGGTVEGVVRFVGDAIPISTEVPVSADVDHCGHNHSLEDYVIDPESRGIRYVIVRLSGGQLKNRSTPPPAHLVLDNRNCRFEPHAAVLTVGSTIECRNSDPILHTTHAYFGERFNFALPDKGSRVTHTVQRPGLTQIRCDKHGWMNSFIWVGRHPFHAVTDVNGRFSITGIPPGDYTIHLWHEQLGEQRRAIIVRPGKTTREQLSYTAVEETDANRKIEWKGDATP